MNTGTVKENPSLNFQEIKLFDSILLKWAKNGQDKKQSHKPTMKRNNVLKSDYWLVSLKIYKKGLEAWLKW
jgi:hypothetical protein